MKLYRVAFEEGEPIMLRLSDEQAAAYRKDPRVAKVTAAKAADEEAASPSARAEELKPRKAAEEPKSRRGGSGGMFRG